jgi:ribosomal subunit interface protein
MKVLIEGKEMSITPALQEHAQKQAHKIEKLGQKVIEVRLFLETIKRKSNDPTANRVTYQVSIPGEDVVVKVHAADMYEAIVKATDAARRKLRRMTEKQRDLKREEGGI